MHKKLKSSDKSVHTFSKFALLALVAHWWNEDQRIAICSNPTVLLDDLLAVGSTPVPAALAAAENRAMPPAPVRSACLARM